jgi:hypothetical protein
MNTDGMDAEGDAKDPQPETDCRTLPPYHFPGGVQGRKDRPGGGDIPRVSIRRRRGHISSGGAGNIEERRRVFIPRRPCSAPVFPP